MTHHYEGLIRDKQIGIGAVDVQDPKVEEGDTVAERVLANAGLRPKTIVTSCLRP